MQEVCGVVVETSIRAFDAKLWRIGAIGYNGTVNTVSKKVEALLDLKMSSMITMGIKRSNRWYLVPYLLFCVLRCTSTQQVRYILCYRYTDALSKIRTDPYTMTNIQQQEATWRPSR